MKKAMQLIITTKGFDTKTKSIISASEKVLLSLFNIGKVITVSGGALESDQEYYQIMSSFTKNSILYEWFFGESKRKLISVSPYKMEKLIDRAKNTLPCYYDSDSKVLVIGPNSEDVINNILIPETYDEFVKEIEEEIKIKDSYLRPGQAVYNYVACVYEIVKYIIPEVDCYYKDQYVGDFVDKVYEKLNELRETKEI